MLGYLPPIPDTGVLGMSQHFLDIVVVHSNQYISYGLLFRFGSIDPLIQTQIVPVAGNTRGGIHGVCQDEGIIGALMIVMIFVAIGGGNRHANSGIDALSL